MILVLLYRFNESEDSILGYRLCNKLVREGHDLLVTTTSKKEEIKREEESARDLSEKYKGSITLLKPKCEGIRGTVSRVHSKTSQNIL